MLKRLPGKERRESTAHNKPEESLQTVPGFPGGEEKEGLIDSRRENGYSFRKDLKRRGGSGGR